MDITNESTQAGETPEKQEGCNDPHKSGTVGPLQGSGSTDQSGSLGSDRAVGGGFFATGQGAICELLAQQMLAEAEKGLENAESCIDWYEREKAAYQERIVNLRAIVEAAREERLQEQAKEEE